MGATYKEFQQLNLPSIEKEMLGNWSAEHAFEKSVENRDGAIPFVFYEGPPSANGMPGIHHVISRTLKDLVCRYKTMKGFQVNRKGGWDTHGLPVELGVEKELGITKEDIGRKISVEEYNEKCREAVLRYKDKWDELTLKMGYWVDLEHPYITFRNEYIETVWWLLKRLYEKGLLYEDVSIQPYSPAAGTGLSSHELNQPGCYKDVKDTSCVAMFKAVRNAKSKFLFDSLAGNQLAATGNRQLATTDEIFLLAWTTTPWTLPSNLGLAVGPRIDYVLIRTFNPYTHLPVNVVLAKALLSKYFSEEARDGDFGGYTSQSKLIPWSMIGEFKGAELEGISYEQLLPFDANKTDNPNAFKILPGDFVTTDEGTGIVHAAPAFGADDFKIGKKYDIGILVMVDKRGKFIDGMGEFSNRYVKNYTDDPHYIDVNVDIAVKLKKENRAFKIEKYEHSYPHCWRTDKPILYYPLDAWFIKTTAARDRMVELNKTIHWKPKSTGEGRFGNWLENMVDWNLSRSRFWGTPLPVWKTDDGEEICIGTVEELKRYGKTFRFREFRQSPAFNKLFEEQGNQKFSGYLRDDFFGKTNEKDETKPSFDNDFSTARALLLATPFEIIEQFLSPIDGVEDLHKPYIDNIILVKNSKIFFRVPDLIDVWFDSGAMPYAQWGLDHQKLRNNDPMPFNKGWEEAFPADFIAEGVDQTRGWFYTLHAIAVLVFDSVAYKTCVSNGLVLDKNGNKMSKRLGNAVDPFHTIDKFGADATRWYLITNASPWDNLKFDVEGIREVQRKFFGTLYNTYQFFVLYANVDGFTFREPYVALEERPEIDRWILSSLNSLVGQVNDAMDEYEPTIAGRLIEEFVDEQLSNWYVRLCRRRFWKGEYELDKICAYQTLYECLDTVVRLVAPLSPFFSDAVFRNLNSVTNRIAALSVHHTNFPKADEDAIDQDLEQRMRLAQDVSSLILSLRKKVNIKVRQPLQRALIPVLNPGMETRLKKVEDLIRSEVNVKEIEYLSSTEGFIKKKIKPNFVLLGKKLGAKMKAVSQALAAFSQDDIAGLEKSGHYILDIGGEALTLDLSEVEINNEDIPGWTVASKGSLTVALDTTVTPALEHEGNAREFVNRIQKIRKESGFELTDRIKVKVAATNGLKNSLAQFNDYICAEILADELELVPEIEDGTEIEINDISLKVIVLKKG